MVKPLSVCFLSHKTLYRHQQKWKSYGGFDTSRRIEESFNELTPAFNLLPPYQNNIGFIMPEIVRRLRNKWSKSER